jgi:uncharacterized protein YgiM (DUF1202 family)
MGAGEIVNQDGSNTQTVQRGGGARLFLSALFLALSFTFAAQSAALNASAEFDQANKLYEQGKFPEAVAAYEAITARGVSTPSLWFNLGNAAYKAGQMGRAVASYRMAERFTPRDPALRANLQFVRGKIYSDERTRLSFWKSLLRLATINEWTMLAAICFWTLCIVLGWGEVTRRTFPKTALLLLALTLLSAIGMLGAIRDQRGEHFAIVTAREVTARFGPLDESQPAFQLRDGAEVTVLHSKGDWLQIRDPEQRTGWIRRDEAIVMPAVVSQKPSPQKVAP